MVLHRRQVVLERFVGAVGMNYEVDIHISICRCVVSNAVHRTYALQNSSMAKRCLLTLIVNSKTSSSMFCGTTGCQTFAQ